MMSLETRSELQMTCQYCGGHVSDRFAAVFGDEEGIVHRCSGCDTFGRLSTGTGAGLEVDMVDPATIPNRNRGQRVGAQLRADGGGDA